MLLARKASICGTRRLASSDEFDRRLDDKAVVQLAGMPPCMTCTIKYLMSSFPDLLVSSLFVPSFST